MRLEELASALDAGIPPAVALDLAAGSTSAADVAIGVTDALAAAGIMVGPTEVEALRASERGGSLVSGLRRCAQAHRNRAALVRELWARLRYPALVLLTAIPTAILAGGVNGHRGRLVSVVLAIPLLAGIAAFIARRLVRSPTFSAKRVRALAAQLIYHSNFAIRGSWLGVG